MSDDDNKLKSPIVGSTRVEYKVPLIEESDEMGSIDYDEEDSIIENSCDSPSHSNFQVYLKIKPKSKRISSNTESIEDNENYYEILNSTTLITRFKANVNRNNSRFLLANVKNDNNLIDNNVGKRYYFTKIFRSDISQEEFFEEIMKKRIVDFLNGQNSTIMTYGTTNSGKTYTLHGTPDQPGLIPRTIEDIFSSINCTLMPWYKFYSNNTLISLDDKERLEESEKKTKLLRSPLINNERFMEARKSLENSERSNKIESERKRLECNGEFMYAVWLSFAEIYNDNIYDLLDFKESSSSSSSSSSSASSSFKNHPLKLISNKNGTTYVKGLTTIYVTTPFEACQILIAGQSRMSTTFTTLNPKCSRSHTIFTIGLLKYQKEYAPHETETSTLTFCDLAGSGRSKELNELNPERLKETKNINKSLLVLGRCLKTIRKKQRKESMKCMNDNVTGPFRESKLTRIFQKALSGNEHVTFLVNIDTSSIFINEIKSILKVSSLARQITPDTKESNLKFILKESNCNTSRINESIISNEFKSFSTTNDENKSIVSQENVIIESEKDRRNDHEESTKNVSIIDDHIKNISEECIYDEKRKRDEELSFVCETNDDDDDDNEDDEDVDDLVISKDLQVENIRAMRRRIRDLENELNNLQRENIVMIENKKYYKKLVHIKRELKDYKDHDKLEINSKLNIRDDVVDNDIDNLTIKLRNVIDEKNGYIDENKSDLRIYQNVEVDDSINDELNEINELRKELTEKTIDIKALTLQLESCERELNETEVACKDAVNRNDVLLKKIEALENVVRYMECERKDTYTPQPPYYLEEISSVDNDHSQIYHSQLERIHSNTDERLSSITDILYFGDGTNNEPTDMIVQAHKNFIQTDLTYVIDNNKENNKDLLEFSLNELRSSYESSKNDSGIVIEESVVDWKKEISNDTNDKKNVNMSILREESKEFEKVSKSLNVKMYEKERSMVNDESNDGSILMKEINEENEESELTTRKSFRSPNIKCQSLEDLSQWLKHRLDLQMAYCKIEHLSKLTNLKRDLSSKTIDLNVANEKLMTANKDLNKLNDLTNKLNDLTIIVAEYNEDRKELYDKLQERTEMQLSLEMKLKHFVSLLEKKDDMITCLRKDLTNIFHINAMNKERIKELDIEIIDIKEKMDSIRKELINSEELRIELEKNSIKEIDNLKSQLTIYENNGMLLKRTVDDLDDKNDELIRVKTQLLRKEREMSLFKSNRDATIKKYEFLVKQLQEEIDKFKDQSRYESTTSMISDGIKKETSNCSIRTRNKFKVSESLKKLTRTGFTKSTTDRNWKTNYLRRKSTDEKSVASTSNFSVSKISSYNESNIMESTSSDNNTKFIDEKELDRTSTIDRTESDVDSNESFSRGKIINVNSEEGTYDDYDDTDDDSDIISCKSSIRNNSKMSGWMRIRRIDARTVLTHCSDIELDVEDRSDDSD
ncbi:kinesin-like protein KIF20B [Vespa crabro]|uniref:kinesin-like protein KIF20B n=1 Tax=Vespa crabro TaxID=7445 RepID=UPI001EFF6FA3|nr:kinesin-like protein KIF20B [Vespa crabro]